MLQILHVNKYWPNEAHDYMKYFPKIIFGSMVLSCVFSFAEMKVAITVDDLPTHGKQNLNMSRKEISDIMLKTFEKHNLSGIYGFINAKKLKNNLDYIEILRSWITSGHLLANHTYSHIDFSATDSNAFIQDIKENEPILDKLMIKKDYKYFRYPFLREGNTLEKRNSARKYLFGNGYKIAQVTIDFEDWAWNDPYSRCIAQKNEKIIAWLKNTYMDAAIKRLENAQILSALMFQRNIKHVLLLHIGAFDAIMLDPLLNEYKKRGVVFIDLKEAIEDPVYRIDPETVLETGDTFLDQIMLQRKVPYPDLKKIVSYKELDSVCR